MAKEKILITSALPYVNNVPHLGNLIGAVLSADAFARFHRLYGNDVLYVLGTDDHGTTAVARAFQEKTTPQALTDKYFKIHQDIYSWFNSTHNFFGRSSSKENHTVTQDIFSKLQKNGFIVEGETQQFYCEKDKLFLSDRLIEGICPHCKSEGARGDQCDKCGKLLEPTQLIKPKCTLDGSTPILKKSKHLFIDLPKLEKQLEKWFKDQSKKGDWTKNSISTTQSWLKEGLQKRPITRDLTWGVPVNQKGFDGKVFYSWFDAPIAYIGMTKQFLPEDWNTWWKGKKTKLYQFIGKDNIPFHSIMFPAYLLGAKDGYTLVHHLNSTEFLNYSDKKFSKSRGTGVFGDQARDTGIDSDVWRYYLYAVRPETADSKFEWDDFYARTNNELVANLGNFVYRTLNLAEKNFKNEVPKAKLTKKEKDLLAKFKKEFAKLTALWLDVKIRDALQKSMELVHWANAYMQEEEPWKSSPEQAARTIYFSLNLIKDFSILFNPFVPNFSNKVWKNLNLSGKAEEQDWKKLFSLDLQSGHKLGKKEIPFQKLDEKQIKAFKEKFG